MKAYGKIRPDGQPAGANRNTPEQAVTAFEKAWLERSNNLPNATPIERAYAQADFRAGFLACAAEAERLCRQPCGHVGCNCSGEHCADAIRQLAEVDRG